MNCTICNSKNNELIYKSNNGSISSLCQITVNNILVFLCNNCSHVYTNYQLDHKKYYNMNYNILTHSEEEDQLYKIINNNKIFRTEHQVDLLLKNFNIDSKTNILDYGCAKSSTMKSLAIKKNIKPYLYDISDNYKKYWDKFTHKDNYATHKTPKSWINKFDIITSFFSLEHILTPYESIKEINKLLKDTGHLFFIVPNFLVNIADLIVNEHINHFTTKSIKYLLETNNFSIISIDFESYEGALVVKAKKEKQINPYSKIIDNNKEIKEIALYWLNINKKIEKIEKSINSESYAIYGSGFYGSLIFSKIKNKNNFSCFLDKNPHRHNLKLYDYKIIDPNDLEEDIKHIIVGLNPKQAEDIIKNSSCFNNKKFYYL